jgi:hypothetical protein
MFKVMRGVLLGVLVPQPTPFVPSCGTPFGSEDAILQNNPMHFCKTTPCIEKSSLYINEMTLCTSGT